MPSAFLRCHPPESGLRLRLGSSLGAQDEMARPQKRLTALAVSKAKKPGIYGDGGGLWLQVSVFDTKSWLFRFMRNGRARKMGLGALHTVSLAEAREAALGCRKLLLEGIDPIEARNARRGALRAANARQVTFRQCAEKYIAGHKAGWRSARHAEQWPTSLEKFVYPFLGNLPVDTDRNRAHYEGAGADLDREA